MPPAPGPAYEALLRLDSEKGETRRRRCRLLAEMHQRFPQDDSVANDYLYFSLLQRVERGCSA